MTWSLFRWTWRLESPLHVGMPPAGSVNRCRLYLPARAVWGAVTAEIARASATQNFPDYEGVGKTLSEFARFTYLFPAEQDGQDWRAWLPRYLKDEGLVWHREDKAGERISDRRFRMRLLSTRPGTAIEPSSDTAAEESLRETECINTCWRDGYGRPGGPVALVGYVFLSPGVSPELRNHLQELAAVAVGGDSRYGLGWLRRIDWQDAIDVFGCKVELRNDGPTVESQYVLSHAKGGNGELFGMLELLRGWDHGRDWGPGAPLWVPGSGADESKWWRPDRNGYWSAAGSRQW